jgi:hypothetical protein
MEMALSIVWTSVRMTEARQLKEYADVMLQTLTVMRMEL